MYRFKIPMVSGHPRRSTENKSATLNLQSKMNRIEISKSKLIFLKVMTYAIWPIITAAAIIVLLRNGKVIIDEQALNVFQDWMVVLFFGALVLFFGALAVAIFFGAIVFCSRVYSDFNTRRSRYPLNPGSPKASQGVE